MASQLKENDPPAWSSVATFASSLAKEAKEKASSLVDEAVAFASEAVMVKTREDLALRSDQHHIALARQHRDLGVRSTQLEDLVLEKRRELEESLVRIEELQAAIAHRQYILAHPVVRPALPEPAVEDRRRAAAAALYMSITTTEDAQEQPAAAGEDDYYGDLYDEDAYYDEVCHGGLEPP